MNFKVIPYLSLAVLETVDQMASSSFVPVIIPIFTVLFAVLLPPDLWLKPKNAAIATITTTITTIKIFLFLGFISSPFFLIDLFFKINYSPFDKLFTSIRKINRAPVNFSNTKQILQDKALMLNKNSSFHIKKRAISWYHSWFKHFLVHWKFSDSKGNFQVQ